MRNRLLESVDSPSNHPAVAAMFTPAQIASRATWSAVPDDENLLAAMHIVHTIPVGGTTITTLNPTDPGTIEDGFASRCWLNRPGHHGRLFRTGRP